MEQTPGEGAGYGADTSYRTQHKLAELVTCSFSSRAQSFFAHCARWLVCQRASENEPRDSLPVLVLVRRSSIFSARRHSQLRKPGARESARNVEVGGSGGYGWRCSGPRTGDRRLFSGAVRCGAVESQAARSAARRLRGGDIALSVGGAGRYRTLHLSAAIPSAYTEHRLSGATERIGGGR
jgi:hypothetical protein